MDAEIQSQKSEAPVHDSLAAWHKPDVVRLTVSLNTGLNTGSFEDGTFFSLHELLSDTRVKRDISGIGNALAGVLALRGVTYRYRTSEYPELGLSDEPQVGFLAQELEQVFPEAVTTRPDGFKAVNYAKLVPVLAEAIKQQQVLIEELQAQVSELKKK